MKERGLIIGRFQPPHLGHVHLIQSSLEKVDELVIVIAAAQLSHSLKNPFTAGERLEMLRLSLQEQNINPNKYWLICVPDIMDNAIWVPHVLRYCPKINVYFGNNPFTNQLISEAGIPILQPELYDRNRYEGTRIRNKILKGSDLTDLLATDVIKLINGWGIQNRFLAFTQTDSTKDGNQTSGTELLRDN
ncbi:MAG: nicotinamide-nucleotide adenylyltransferase [Candidatus Heimdallarchaeota archaeon]|nr:nicotinamide-nucleotide adenylyltransferase [Candidatus Heimdallarchaeota archaeon]MDH5647888.1 nicotinamide-nucleotide adenylyltransferase [Candidatus Heimdallarchaeota archaeon]